MNSSLDEQIASLSFEVDEGIRTDLHGALRTLRDARNIPGAVITLSRMLEGSAGLLGAIAARANCKLKGHTLDAQIEQLAQAGTIPSEIASDMHWIRVRATKARHNIERVALELDDAEFALSRALKALRWFYCQWDLGPRWASLQGSDATTPAALSAEAHKFQQLQQATSAERLRLQSELAELKVERQQAGPERPEFATAGPIPWMIVKQFRGRVEPLVRLAGALAGDEARLIVVQGRGGIGKTALLVKQLDELRKSGGAATRRFSGIAYLNLAQPEQRSPDRLVQLLRDLASDAEGAKLAHVWEDRASSDLRLDRLFQEHLRRTPLVIALDGLEHILAGDNTVAPQYADLGLFLQKSVQYEHAVKVVALSRRALFLSSELEGAAGNHRRDIPLDDGLDDADAVALLRALDHDGALRLRDAPEEKLAKAVSICHGMPRLLERVVGTLRQRPTWNLARLASMPDGLARIAQDPARELFESLAAEERLVLQSLAVYGRPVAATAVRFLLPGLDVEEVLDRFVRDFVVGYEYESFSLSALDRDYAYRSLPEGEAASDYGRRGLHRLAAEFFDSVSKPPAECRDVHELDPHLERFRHKLAAGEIVAAYETCRGISTRLDAWGNSSTLLQMRLSLVGLLKEPGMEAQNLAYIGWVYTTQDEAAKAKECLERAVSLAEGAGDLRAHASALNSLGVAVWQLQGAAESAPLFEQAKLLAERGGHEFEQARSLGNHGLTQAELGRSAEAIAEYEAAEAIYRRLGRTQSEGIQLGNIGLEHLRCGRLREAREFSERALAIAAAQQARDNESSWTMQLAAVADYEGRGDEAARLYARALDFAREAGNRTRTCDILCELGLVRLRGGDVAEAIRCRDAIKAELRGVNRAIETCLRYLTANIGLATGDLEAALADCRAAIEIDQRRGCRYGEIRAKITLTRLLAALGRGDEAHALGEATREQARAIGYSPLERDAANAIGVAAAPA